MSTFFKAYLRAFLLFAGICLVGAGAVGIGDFPGLQFYIMFVPIGISLIVFVIVWWIKDFKGI